MRFYRINSEWELDILENIEKSVSGDLFNTWRDKVEHNGKITIRIGHNDMASGFIVGHGSFYETNFRNTDIEVVYLPIPVFKAYMGLL